MYALSRMNRVPMVRRQAALWPATEDFFRPFVEMVNTPMRTSVKETETGYQFDAELPGYDPSEIELTILDGTLTIAAEHKEGEEGSDSFATRSLRRSFTLDGIDEDGIGAEYKNGVLRITLPKAKAPDAPEARRIDIR